MLDILKSWLDRRRAIRGRWQAHARRLVREDEQGAYYEAQRLAARARAEGRGSEFAHWANISGGAKFGHGSGGMVPLRAA